MAKICFVSYEIHPTVKGGCGVLLNNAARILLPQGHEIIFLLHFGDKEFTQFNSVDRLNLPNSQNCRAYQVLALAKQLKYSQKNFHSVFEYRAYQVHAALEKIYHLEKPDIIEFFDYCGIGYEAINYKVAGLGYQESHLAVRLHGSLELIDQQQPGNIHGIDRYIMYGLEHHALRLGESVLYPSSAFLEKIYQTNYEPWYGNKVFSKPPLVDLLEPVNAGQDPRNILFYGRLHGIKGVDIFIDAAILYLTNPNNPTRHFYLVGYDSFSPPGSWGSYQTYLLRKIPAQFQQYFHFTGQLSRQELGKLLPDVLFAVIPSYFESFCYSAHELYEAGVPLIVSNIPSFENYFQHEENALVFDGTVSDLNNQMIRLVTDSSLRKKITRPYSLIQNPLGDFYTHQKVTSWIKSQVTSDLPSLLVCILCDHPENLAVTLQTLKPVITMPAKLVFAYPVEKDSSDETLAWFLGKSYSFKNEHGESLHPTQVFTEEALLILKAGDTLEPSYITTGLQTLRSQSQISFVGGWKKKRTGRKTSIDTLPLDAAIELAPFMDTPIFSRFIIRTPMRRLLIDLFDLRAGSLGELDFLWKADNETSCGVMIPEIMVNYQDKDELDLETNTIDYLVIRDRLNWRKRRIARLILSTFHRSNTLRRHFYNEKVNWMSLRVILVYGFTLTLNWLTKNKLGSWILKKTGLMRILRKTALGYSILGPDKDR